MRRAAAGLKSTADNNCLPAQGGMPHTAAAGGADWMPRKLPLRPGPLCDASAAGGHQRRTAGALLARHRRIAVHATARRGGATPI